MIIQDPVAGEGQVFRSGDLGRFLPDGSIEYMGRKDFQVKIRGYRIELDKIESCLLKVESVKEAVVIAREDDEGNKILCAYIVAEKEFTTEELKEHLTKQLPDYMMPAYFVKLDKLPLTPNGKIDRKALPEIQGNMSTGVEYVAPNIGLEKMLVDIWEEVLGIEGIGVKDNFFDLGGNSLKAITLASKIHKQFNKQIPFKEVFTKPTVRAMAKYIQEANESINTSIIPVEDKEYYPLSSTQKRLFALCEIENIFNTPTVVMIEGLLERVRIETAFKELIERHEVFRTSFEYREGKPAQIVHKEVEFRLEYLEAEEDGIENILNRFIRKFDLTKAPLIRVLLVRLSEQKYLLAVDMHNLITDVKSFEIIINELLYLYEGIELPEVKVRYRDFAEWQRKQFEQPRIKEHEEFWNNVFKDGIPRLKMPLDFERPERPVFEVDTIKSIISGEKLHGLKEFVTNNNITLNVLFFSLYSILLSKFCGQEDIVVGTIVEGRDHPEVKDSVGFYVYTVPVRLKIKEEDTLLDIVRMASKAHIDAYKHMGYPFEKLTEGSTVDKDPLMDTLINFYSVYDSNIEIEGLKISDYYIKPSTDMDFNADVIDTPSELIFNIKYNTRLFKEETMMNFLKCLVKLADEVLKDPDRKISGLEFLL